MKTYSKKILYTLVLCLIMLIPFVHAHAAPAFDASKSATQITTTTFRYHLLPKITATTAKNIKTKTLSSVALEDFGTVIKYTDGSTFIINSSSPLAGLTKNQVKSLVASFTSTLKGISTKPTLATQYVTDGFISDEKMTSILSGLGLGATKDDLVVSSAIANSVRSDFVTIDVSATLDQIAQTMSEIFSIASNSDSTGYYEYGPAGDSLNYHHGYEAGAEDSGEVEFYVKGKSESGENAGWFFMGSSDHDKDNDGEEDDDDTSFWDDLGDWLCGCDAEGDGITNESERGHGGHIFYTEFLIHDFMYENFSDLQNIADQYANNKLNLAQAKQDFGSLVDLTEMSSSLSRVMTPTVLKTLELSKAPTVKAFKLNDISY